MSSLCNAGRSHSGVIRTVIILYMFSTVLASVIAVFASMIFPVDMVLQEHTFFILTQSFLLCSPSAQLF